MASAHVNENVRYEPDESPPRLVTVGSGLQAATVIVAPVVLTVVVVARIADQADSYLSWAVFAALLVSGATTVLQAVRVGRFGAGHVLMMGTSGAFIAVCVAALIEGGRPRWRASSSCRRCSSSHWRPACRCYGGYSRRSSPAR